MKQLESIMEMLGRMDRPAFCVSKGSIVAVNQHASARLITVGTPIRDLIYTGEEEYAVLKEGSLCMTLRINNINQPASVEILGAFHLFVLEQDADLAELNAMALAARELREPLSNVLTVADRLFPMSATTEDAKDQAARINRGLYQMLRIISNMSDALQYSQGIQHNKQLRNITAMLEETFRKSSHLMEQAGFHVHFRNISESILCMVDEDMLERAIYNILSNAAKFTPPDGHIEATAIRRGSKLYLTVQDSGAGVDPALRQSIHVRYQRTPGYEDSRFGIGLGMVLIRSAAAAHGGTVLMEYPADRGTRITMTIALTQDNILRDNALHVDYAGERDHALIELSDRLPHKVYYPEHIN